MKTSLFIAILFIQSICFGHEYQRAEYELNCGMSATKQTLVLREAALPRAFSFSVNAKIVDGKFLSLYRDPEVVESDILALPVKEDYSTAAVRPSSITINSFGSPLARPNSFYGITIAIKSHSPQILNESVTTDVYGLMRFQNTGAPDPAELQDIVRLFNAFGEPMTNPQDLVIEMKTEGRQMTAYPTQAVSIENEMQMHFPENINGGASYHFRMVCTSHLKPVY